MSNLETSNSMFCMFLYFKVFNESRNSALQEGDDYKLAP